MTETTITSALKILNPLLSAIETAYWDSSEIEIKDRMFDLVSCIHGELNELAKLSVSDLELPYEAITPEFAACSDKFLNLEKNIDTFFPRSKTSCELKKMLPQVTTLITSRH